MDGAAAAGVAVAADAPRLTAGGAVPLDRAMEVAGRARALVEFAERHALAAGARLEAALQVRRAHACCVCGRCTGAGCRAPLLGMARRGAFDEAGAWSAA